SDEGVGTAGTVAGGAFFFLGSNQGGDFVGQIVDVEQAVDVEHQHAFDAVTKLPNVAGPVVAQERLTGRTTKASDFFLIPGSEFLDEVVEQQRNVLPAVTQWRERNRDRVQPIIKVL